MGRPIRFESEARRREFVRLVAAGVSLYDAATRAKLNYGRALRMADSPEMLDLLVAAKPGHWSTLRDELQAIREA